mgnify:CR=1 FL=1
MEVGTLKASIPSQSLPGAPKSADSANSAVAAKATNATPDPVTVDQQIKDVSGAEKERLDTVVNAANNYANNFAVSDTKFTIFKDSSGQFVTRFTSLKDGSVTYIPEPDIASYVQSNSDRRGSLKLDA